MATLWLQFLVHVQDWDLDFPRRPAGPLFHRWLPNGETDAIRLETGEEDSELKVWFERRGFVSNGSIHFKHDRKEVDTDLMSKQGILDAGPLSGLLKISNLDSDDLKPVEENKLGDPKYVALGKRVVLKLLYPPIQRFLETIKRTFGQYWVKPIERWDKRTSSLGHYCSMLGMKWRTDSEASWSDFCPDKSIAFAIGAFSSPDHGEYLDRNAWGELAVLSTKSYDPSFAAGLLSQARRSFDEGKLKYAYVEAVTALETAIDEKLKTSLGQTIVHLKVDKVPLPQQMVLVARLTSDSSIFEVEMAMKAIETRNKIVHEGKEPDRKTADQLAALLRVIQRLIPGPKLRSPDLVDANIVKTEEQWQEIYKDPTKLHQS